MSASDAHVLKPGMRRVLVTGAGGFIGRHALEPLLLRGFEVHALSLHPARDLRPEVVPHVCDLFDAAATARLLAEVRPTHLLHLAWYTAPDRFWDAPQNVGWLQASLGLVTAFHEHGGKRVLVAGSCAEYDWRYGFCSEMMTPTVPATLYGACKHALDVAVGHYARRVGLSHAHARLFFLFGPHEKPARLVASMVRALIEQKTAACTAGMQVRDFSHVADVAGALAATLDSDFSGPVNLGSGQPVSVKEIVLRIADQLDRRELVHFGERPPAPDDPPLLVPDVRTLHERIGWRDRFDLDAGLADTIRWWRSRLESERT